MGDVIYYVHINGQQAGPYELSQLGSLGITGDTMVWRSDLPNWVKAHTLPEVIEIIEPAVQPPVESVQPVEEPRQQAPETSYPQQPQQPYGSQQQYGPQQPYGMQYGPQHQYGNQPIVPGNNMLPPGWVNWKGWAVAGTVLGIFTCCLGWIFGIIGLIRATEANTYAKAGRMDEANVANSSAKTMTLISVILGGVSLLIIMVYTIAVGSVMTALMDIVGSGRY